MTYTASCHCGATRFEIDIAPTDLTECNCTYCAKVGGLWAYYDPKDVRVVRAESDGLYDPTGYNKHHFCKTCGITAYTISPKWSLDGEHDLDTFHIGVNARLFDGLDIAAIPIQQIDGRNLW